MAALHPETHVIRTEQDVVLARQLVRRVSQAHGFSLVDQTKLVTAASELGRNALKYGGGGSMHCEVLREPSRVGVRLLFSDEGPGIPDIDAALTDGFTTGAGLGMGLSGTRRLVNEFSIDSAPGTGTRVTVVRWTPLR